MKSAERDTNTAKETSWEDIVLFIEQEVWNQLCGSQVEMKRLSMLSERSINDSRSDGFARLSGIIGIPIEQAYGIHNDVVNEVARTVANMTQAKFGQKTIKNELSQELLQRLEIAFTETKYVGVAHDTFAKYLRRCWKVYNSTKYKAPYVTVVQSSGFGKSRMLFELARKVVDTSADEHDPTFNMRVLYTCVRRYESTGYPQTTESLRDWLFPKGCTAAMMTSRLKAIYDYASTNWEDVQTEWIKLFTERAVDKAVVQRLEKINPVVTPQKPKEDCAEIKKHEKGKMVVLMIDEARSLLTEARGNISHFRMLRHALALVNDDIGVEGGIFGVLIDTNSKISDLTPPVSLDPSSRVYKENELASFPPFVLTHSMDAYWREYCKEMETNAIEFGGEEVEMEDEETIGVGKKDNQETKISTEIAIYKTVVTGDKDEAWKALMRMGRPMWWSTFNNSAAYKGLPPTAAKDVVSLAANKLLLGHQTVTNMFNEDTLFGVASMLSRLGIRPYSTSPLASRVVADFMAILAYVDFEREAYLSSYVSDPVLTLGAMKLWYARNDGLAKYILPQLKKLILNEALDTGGVGEMVARILLLLAMDKCVMGGGSFSDYKITGQFVSVEAFLKVLGGEDLPIFSKWMDILNDEKAAFTMWQSQWKDWYVGFTHFVQLQLEPNEDTLWYLLGRRAAGIFPQNQFGADLLIPIFRKKSVDGTEMETDASAGSSMETDAKAKVVEEADEKVSLILIQVKSRQPKDMDFSQSATMKLCPRFVFRNRSPTSAENPLSKKPVNEVVRIYMNLREEVVIPKDKKNPSKFKFIYSTTVEDNKPIEKKKGKKKEGEKSSGGDAVIAGGVPATDVAISEGVPATDLATSEGVPAMDMAISESVSEQSPTAQPMVYTYCFRSLGCKTYSFLDKDVASSLASIVQSIWHPMAIVDGDLERRHTIENDSKTFESKAILSEVMADSELREIASQGFAYAPGQEVTTTLETEQKLRPQEEGGTIAKRAKYAMKT